MSEPNVPYHYVQSARDRQVIASGELQRGGAGSIFQGLLTSSLQTERAALTLIIPGAVWGSNSGSSSAGLPRSSIPLSLRGHAAPSVDGCSIARRNRAFPFRVCSSTRIHALPTFPVRMDSRMLRCSAFDSTMLPGRSKVRRRQSMSFLVASDKPPPPGDCARMQRSGTGDTRYLSTIMPTSRYFAWGCFRYFGWERE